jgi:hypothetical protein
LLLGVGEAFDETTTEKEGANWGRLSLIAFPIQLEQKLKQLVRHVVRHLPVFPYLLPND